VIERAIEGDRSARIRLDKAPTSPSKIFKRVAKHSIWLLISLLTGGAWIFYFADAPTLFVELFTLQASNVAYGTVGTLTFLTYSLGGLMREQVCIYMCPWPRIQAVMMDEESATVTYRVSRGEPRAPYKKGDSWDNRGHCVDCKACIVACPTGIDIRDGQQLECITCALCIDACDTVMKKIGLLPGLIDYDSMANIDRLAKGQPSEMKIIRPRTVFYFVAWVLAGLIMLITILWRPDLDTNVLRDRNPLFTLQSNGSISNGYTVKILNKVHSIRTFAISTDGVDGMTINVIGASGSGPSYRPLVSVDADRMGSFRMVLNAPPGTLTSDTTHIRFVIEDIASDSETNYDSVFRGPKK
jgi:cytochrome c oxidase accessory protein FixG